MLTMPQNRVNAICTINPPTKLWILEDPIARGVLPLSQEIDMQVADVSWLNPISNITIFYTQETKMTR